MSAEQSVSHLRGIDNRSMSACANCAPKHGRWKRVALRAGRVVRSGAWDILPGESFGGYAPLVCTLLTGKPCGAFRCFGLSFGVGVQAGNDGRKGVLVERSLSHV